MNTSMPVPSSILQLSPELQAAQLLMPSLHPAKFAANEEYRAACIDLAERGVGGFCVFQGTMDEAAQAIAELQACADVPLLFSADYEHGLPMRLEGGTDFPHAMALGIGRETSVTKSVAAAIAREAKAIGIHWNFAPVCDVNTNSLNPIINTRAFGETLGEVLPHISAWISGTQEHGVAACAKHFPGHGDCAVDSHRELPVLEHSRERLSSVELVPFLSAIRSQVKTMMIGHLAVPAFDASGLPASLSHVLITDVLRSYMKFDGVVVTDALDMHAISAVYSSSQACFMSIMAGADIALVPADPMEALEHLKACAADGSLPAERIRESFLRVCELKSWCGLFERKAYAQEVISLEEHGMLALKAATNAVRVKGNHDILPIETYNHLACFALVQDSDIDPGSEFFHYLSQVYEKDTDIAYLNADVSDEALEDMKKSTETAEAVLFAVFASARAYAGTVELHPRLMHAARELSMYRPVIAVLFGNPYIAETFPADVHVVCYSDSKASRGAACLALSKKSLNL
ncbi:MAG: glycoside hydrolase family 3 protein [Candidatus Kapaibacterium sp.]|jgi:beta-N-acetylhexosaminidase